ncbi:MAG: YfiR family protein [Deltaproteobacteria bacterium]|nr:YfiR family protein [Deltaproteobacteria bacterium]
MNRCGALLGLVLVAKLLLAPLDVLADSKGQPAGEYRVKAAFLYKFLDFVGLPEKAGEEKVASLCILGKDPFGSFFEAVEGRPVGSSGRVLKVHRLARDASAQELRKCALLFVARSESESVRDVLEKVRKYPVLTVSETSGFVEAGGIINLVVRNRKVRWEVNYDAVEEAGLRLSSQILRNAVRVLRRQED